MSATDILRELFPATLDRLRAWRLIAPSTSTTSTRRPFPPLDLGRWSWPLVISCLLLLAALRIDAYLRHLPAPIVEGETGDREVKPGKCPPDCPKR